MDLGGDISLECVTLACLLKDPKAAEFELGLEEEKVLHQIQDVVQAVLPPGHMIQQMQWYLKFMADKDVLWSL